jgi:hypothetical protein
MVLRRAVKMTGSSGGARTRVRVQHPRLDHGDGTARDPHPAVPADLTTYGEPRNAFERMLRFAKAAPEEGRKISHDDTQQIESFFRT